MNYTHRQAMNDRTAREREDAADQAPAVEAARAFATILIQDRPQATLGEVVIAAFSAFMSMNEHGESQIVGCAKAVEEWVNDE